MGFAGFPKIWGYFLGGPHNKDCSIWGSILESPYLGIVPFMVWGLAFSG